MPVLNNYINQGINPIPGSLWTNDDTFTSYPPGVEWGAQAIYNLSPAFQVAAGMFNTNQTSALGGKGGVNFALQQGNRGVLSVVQVSYFLNHAPDDKGVPGQYSFGGFYDSNRFANLNNPNSTKSGLYSIYGMFQQMVYRDGGAGSQKGLTVWGEAAVAPRSIVSFMPYFIGGGLSYQGADSPARQRYHFSRSHLWDVQPLRSPRDRRDCDRGELSGYLNQLAVDYPRPTVCHQAQRQQCNQERAGAGRSSADCVLDLGCKISVSGVRFQVSKERRWLSGKKKRGMYVAQES